MTVIDSLQAPGAFLKLLRKTACVCEGEANTSFLTKGGFDFP
jgi:hypothetical protein